MAKIKSDNIFFNLWRLAEVKDLKPNIDYVFIKSNWYSKEQLKKTNHNLLKIEKYPGETNEHWKEVKEYLKKRTRDKEIYIRK